MFYEVMRRVVIFTCFFCVVVYGQILQDESNITDTPSLEQTYADKICRSEKTCDLINKVHADLRTLKHRNCMCDQECVKYGDCCEDSLYQIQNQNLSNIEPFHCSPTEKIYMKTSCPSNYTNRSVIGKCESSMRPLKSENKKLYIPVTNVHYNITYGNEYCAICNNDYTYQTWSLIPRCWVVYQPPVETSTVRLERSIDLISQIAHNEMISTTTEYIDWYAIDLEEAKKRIQFNAQNKTFFSKYKGKVYECQYNREIPNDLVPHVRDCVPAISNCTSKKDSLKLCRSYTSVVYDIDSQIAYKNVDCARCNGVSGNLYGCSHPPTRITGSSLFTTSDKNSGKPPRCSDVKVREKFC